MKMTSMDLWTVVVPSRPGRVNSPEWVPEVGWDVVPKHILRINTDTEHYGLGESGRGVPVEDVRAGAALVLGRDPEALTLQNIYEPRSDGTETMLNVGTGPAYHALEMAVFDLIGRARGLPVHALMGGAVRDRVRADYWMGSQTPEDGKRTVARALEHGFKGIKIKCRIEEPMVERLRAIRDVAGPEFKVTVDPNERFRTAAQTIELARELEVLGNVEVFEDPIPKSDLDGYAAIYEATSIPIAMHLGSGSDVIRAVKAGVVDCVNLGGSMLGFVKSAAVAEAAGMRCWHGSGVDLGILEASYVHAVAAVPNCTMASDIVGSWVREHSLIRESREFADGFTPVPMAPGLGCELDMAAVERYSRSRETVQAP